MRRVALIASASGNGKTTVGRALAQRLGVQFVELDSLVHGPNWQETSDEDLREQLEPVLRGNGWVIDGTYMRKLGTIVLDAADTVVWLDPRAARTPRPAAAPRASRAGSCGAAAAASRCSSTPAATRTRGAPAARGLIRRSRRTSLLAG